MYSPPVLPTMIERRQVLQFYLNYTAKVKVKFAEEQDTKAQRGSRNIALFFL